ncbi:MAG: peptidylprolyl isomerase [Lachnospiraceae bacterium]|nr:peptidylprolyl isomerase [Lachnospiraceae bacterium]
MSKKIISLLLSVVLLLGLCACGNGAESSQPSTVAPSSLNELLFPQTDLDATAISTEHFSLSKGEMVYLFANSLTTFINRYYDYISYIGLDPTKSFKEQTSIYGQSWFDFFLEDATAFAEDYLLFCEAAYALGLTVDEEAEAAIEADKKMLEEEAAAYGWSLDTYLTQIYSTNLEWKYVESADRIRYLAQKAYTQLLMEHSFTEEEIEAEFQKNAKLYTLVDLYAVDFGDGENIPDKVIARAREALAAVTTYEDFYNAVKEFLLAARTTTALEDAGGLDKYAEKYMSEALLTGQSYQNNELYNWAFGEEAKEGSVYLIENSSTNAPAAYFLLKSPYRDETVTIDVRHILFMLQAYGGKYETIEAAHAAAETVLQQWISEGKDPDRFIELCAQYSEDGNASSGGLYTDVPQGQMVPTFNDWCFDESRQPGDYGIVDTDFGAHIMYFEGSHVAWAQNAENTLFDELYQKIRSEQEALTPIQKNEEVLKSINW